MLVRNSGSNITRRKLLGDLLWQAPPSPCRRYLRPRGQLGRKAFGFGLCEGQHRLETVQRRRDYRRGHPGQIFNNLIDVVDTFEDLSGIKVRFDKIPPGQIRQKAMLDLSSKTGYATHAADPMYYPLYVANGWVEPLDGYLGNTRITDAKWFDYNDILQDGAAAPRSAASLTAYPMMARPRFRSIARTFTRSGTKACGDAR